MTLLQDLVRREVPIYDDAARKSILFDVARRAIAAYMNLARVHASAEAREAAWGVIRSHMQSKDEAVVRYDVQLTVLLNMLTAAAQVGDHQASLLWRHAKVLERRTADTQLDSTNETAIRAAITTLRQQLAHAFDRDTHDALVSGMLKLSVKDFLAQLPQFEALMHAEYDAERAGRAWDKTMQALPHARTTARRPWDQRSFLPDGATLLNVLVDKLTPEKRQARAASLYATAVKFKFQKNPDPNWLAEAIEANVLFDHLDATQLKQAEAFTEAFYHHPAGANLLLKLSRGLQTKQGVEQIWIDEQSMFRQTDEITWTHLSLAYEGEDSTYDEALHEAIAGDFRMLEHFYASATAHES